MRDEEGSLPDDDRDVADDLSSRSGVVRWDHDFEYAYDSRAAYYPRRLAESLIDHLAAGGSSQPELRDHLAMILEHMFSYEVEDEDGRSRLRALMRIVGELPEPDLRRPDAP